MNVNIKEDALEISVNANERTALRRARGVLRELGRYADVNEKLTGAVNASAAIGEVLGAMDGEGVVAVRLAEEGEPELKTGGDSEED